MKNKMMSKIAAIGIASLTAISAMAMSVSALDTTTESGKTYATGKIYPLTVATTNADGSTSTTNYWFTSETARDTFSASAPGTKTNGTAMDVTSKWSAGTTIYTNAQGMIANSADGVGGTANVSGTYTVRGTGTNIGSITTGSTYYGSNVPSVISSSTGIHYASTSNVVYRGTIQNKTYYFPTYSSLVSAGAKYVESVTPSFSYDRANADRGAGDSIYFDVVNGYFTLTPDQNTVSISGKTSTYDTYSGYSLSDTVYKVNGIYYPTYASAYDAAGGKTSLMSSYSSYSVIPDRFFSMKDGQFYPTYASALSHAGSDQNYVIDMSYYYDWYYSPYYVNPFYAYDNTYYGYWNGTYYNGYWGNAYWFDKYYGTTTTTTTTSTNDKSTATSGNYKGWTTINRHLSNAKTGSNITVYMNQETTVPADTLTAIKGKDITVRFILANGVVFAVNGKSVSNATAMTIDTRYNTKYVPTKLVKAASTKNKAVSTAQITISGSSFGAKADVTVKLSSKRAGKTAKLYRYNMADNTLALVGSGKIQNSGKVTFSGVNQGGNFVIIIC